MGLHYALMLKDPKEIDCNALYKYLSVSGEELLTWESTILMARVPDNPKLFYINKNGKSSYEYNS